MSNFSKDIEKCKKHDSALDDFVNTLDRNVTYKASKNEVIISNLSKGEVEKRLYSLPIDKSIIKLLFSVTEAKGNIYVRKKMK